MENEKLKIKFYPLEDWVERHSSPPAPASRFVPEWYRLSDRKAHDEKIGKDFSDIKMCVPYLDGLLSGYMITTPSDLQVIRKNNELEMYSEYEYPFIRYRGHQPTLKKMPRPTGHDKRQWAWKLLWGVETPPGWSTLYIHPMGRWDLPFTVPGAIVDTDNFYLPGEIPTFFKSNFSGIIPAGTPIIQIIPFKRSDWETEVMPALNEENDKFFEVLRGSPEGGVYKKEYWVRKKYK